ncbi:ATP-binding protein [Streptosporangium lutulentum]|uniref:Anti-sigma regulatory factor (Ser/Thr protein kinase) n=1 Tax=Streptosporangium lutulentum TaxID=1461250 RepID=A0ABT9QRJ1_9ACTN|nr:ATP-binding protein [Streptosporangium lutulentum]MDP9848544.1 anti-sigma regulatory factor (Ser/Thr protein kinase) [Streptosporangium lutulentum]
MRESRLPGDPEAASRARDEVREWLGCDHPAYENVRLAVSELVTNAVRHSRMEQAGVVESDPLILRLTAHDDLLRVEVTDKGWTMGNPRVRTEPVPHLAESGRGLAIVSALSDGNWGYHSHGPGPGRTVWCEIPAAPLTSEDPSGLLPRFG